MKIRSSIFILLVFPLLFSFSPVPAQMGNSLEWQKIELEKSIRDQVVSTIAPVILSGEYIVNVAVKARPPQNIKPTPGGGAEKKNSRVKFNDIDPKQARGDYIVLSKLGLEAPLYQEQEKKEGKGKEEAEAWQKFISEYMDNYDLFKLLESVTVSVKLDNYLGDDTKTTVEELINGLNLQYGSAKAKIDISYIDMKEMKKELDKRKLNRQRELFEWIGRIGQPVGMIIAVLLLGIFAYFIFKKYAELQEKQLEMMNQQMAQQKIEQNQEKKKEDDEAIGADVLAGHAGTVEDAREDGMERFKAMILNNPIESSLMIKRWIKEPTRMNQNVLNLLVKELSGDQLAKVFESVTLEERKTWKRYIGKALKPHDIVNAKRYIGNQVVQEMIIPNTITDTEAVELLIRINPEESALFCKEDPKLAAILMSVMNAKFLSKMMDNLSQDTIQALLKESFTLNNERINGMLSEFKSKLSKHVRIDTASPFMEKLIELIPLSSPQRERTLYESLAQSSSPEKVLDIARNFFPSELLFKMPDLMLKSFVQTFPREKRPEMVLILEGKDKQKFMDVIAPNQKSRDMLNLDLEKFESNKASLNKVMENKESLLKEFTDHCRKQIRANPSHLKDLEPIIAEWIASLGIKFDENEPSLRIVA